MWKFYLVAFKLHLCAKTLSWINILILQWSLIQYTEISQSCTTFLAWSLTSSLWHMEQYFQLRLFCTAPWSTGMLRVGHVSAFFISVLLLSTAAPTEKCILPYFMYVACVCCMHKCAGMYIWANTYVQMSTLGANIRCLPHLSTFFLRQALLLSAAFTSWPVNPWDLLVSALHLYLNTGIQT